MDHAAALRLLGLPANAPLRDVRARFVELLWTHHPDVAGATPDQPFDAAQVVEAYRVLRTTGPMDGEARASVEVRADGDTLVVALPPDETFLALADVAFAVGHVAYIDVDAGLLETVVNPTGAPACSLVITVQGRAAGGTEAFCTIEAIGRGPSPAIEDVVEELRDLVDGSLNSA